MDESAAADSLITWRRHAWHTRVTVITHHHCTLPCDWTGGITGKPDGCNRSQNGVFARADAPLDPSWEACVRMFACRIRQTGQYWLDSFQSRVPPPAVWPFKQGERWMAGGQRSIMQRSMSHFVCLLAHRFALSFLNLLSSLRHTVLSGVEVETSAVIALGNIAAKAHANASALNIRLHPYQDALSFSFSFYYGSGSCLWWYLHLQANIRQIALSQIQSQSWAWAFLTFY